MNPLICLPLILSLFFTNSVSLPQPNIRRPRPTGGLTPLHGQRRALSSVAFDPNDFQTFYYNQTLDHFNYRPDSYATFQQRYVINSKHWGGSNTSAPIFVYMGAESSLDLVLPAIGFLRDNAVQFQALQIYTEHRYYGKSIPFGSREEAFKNASTLGYFNSAQALADYAEILIHVKKQLHAKRSPVIVIGGSYGGMLAAWFRLKYPHVAVGALASSAPILYFDNIVSPKKGYFSIVTKNFREASESCYQTIKVSWSQIEEIASGPNGLSILSKKFHTCSPLGSPNELEGYLESMYIQAAQYDEPPSYPVTMICNGIDGISYGNDTLSKLFAGVVAYRGNQSCYINERRNYSSETIEGWSERRNYSSETIEGWSWQECSEMVMPISVGNDTMFPPDDGFDLDAEIRYCNASYGVPPRPHWVTTYYGGHDIKLALHRFGSNIIFSNGLRDPYSSGGVLDNISESIVAVTTKNGSHCLDILSANHTTDPDWLVTQRKVEVKIIRGWLAKYYAELRAFK